MHAMVEERKKNTIQTCSDSMLLTNVDEKKKYKSISSKLLKE